MNRLSIEVDGLSHGDLPIPVASRIGPFLVTGGVRGVNRLTHELPEDASEQADLMFANLVAVLEAGGAATPRMRVKNSRSGSRTENGVPSSTRVG